RVQAPGQRRGGWSAHPTIIPRAATARGGSPRMALPGARDVAVRRLGRSAPCQARRKVEGWSRCAPPTGRASTTDRLSKGTAMADYTLPDLDYDYGALAPSIS